VATLWLGAAVALDWFGRMHAASGRWDAILVPGCRVWRGGVPSKALRRRVERAVELHKKGHAPEIVFTGGIGDHAPAEAVAAAKYAQELGITASVIRMEPRSKNTLENARYARELIGDRRILVVTDAYHVLRCKLIFERYFSSVMLVGVPLGKLPPFTDSMREVLAFVWLGLVMPFGAD
jgi:uncharacterized SAM-binding protein YcdF (DUF218 family)